MEGRGRREGEEDRVVLADGAAAGGGRRPEAVPEYGAPARLEDRVTAAEIIEYYNRTRRVQLGGGIGFPERDSGLIMSGSGLYADHPGARAVRGVATFLRKCFTEEDPFVGLNRTFVEEGLGSEGKFLKYKPGEDDSLLELPATDVMSNMAKAIKGAGAPSGASRGLPYKHFTVGLNDKRSADTVFLELIGQIYNMTLIACNYKSTMHERKVVRVPVWGDLVKAIGMTVIVNWAGLVLTKLKR